VSRVASYVLRCEETRANEAAVAGTSGGHLYHGNGTGISIARVERVCVCTVKWGAGPRAVSNQIATT
jgi:hypothetical protein